jgi:hypothetical protein
MPFDFSLQERTLLLKAAQWSYVATLLARRLAASIIEQYEVVYTGLAHRQ